MERPSVSVIGTGALGTVLVKGLHQHGYTIHSLFNRHLRKAEALSREVNASYVSEFPERRSELGSLVFLTVQDSEIVSAAQQLTRLSGSFSGYLFVHCSGNESSIALRALKQRGADVAAFHPLQTFTSHSAPEDFYNSYFDVEGNAGAMDPLKEVARALGAHTLEISAESKAYLHAAAVMASNYLVSLLDASSRIAGLGDIPEQEALNALLPLVYKSIENVENRNPRSALSGPIKRGDLQTVKKHLNLLREDPALLSLYKQLGLHTLTMASGSKGKHSGKYSQIQKLLENDADDDR